VCHVLIIEDEPLLSLLIRDLLEDVGATSFAFAATQEDAIAAASEEPPEFITSDVRLLSGSGPQAVAAILEHLGPIPVVFITATPGDCDPTPVGARIFLSHSPASLSGAPSASWLGLAALTVVDRWMQEARI
jgi:CheY-like chemotaxis protein